MLDSIGLYPLHDSVAARALGLVEVLVGGLRRRLAGVTVSRPAMLATPMLIVSLHRGGLEPELVLRDRLRGCARPPARPLRWSVSTSTSTNSSPP